MERHNDQAIDHITAPTRVSSTRQERGFVNKGANIWPPRLRLTNQRAEAQTAPDQKNQRDASCSPLLTLPSRTTVSR